MYKGLHPWVIGRLNIFIKDTVEYINAEGESCPCDRGIKYFIKDIIEYTDVAAASCLGNRGIKYIYTRYCRIY
jgi:hypothetical protein